MNYSRLNCFFNVVLETYAIYKSPDCHGRKNADFSSTKSKTEEDIPFLAKL